MGEVTEGRDRWLPMLVEELRCACPAVISVYVIGSHADGSAVEASDVDLAVLLDHEPHEEDREAARTLARSAAARMGTRVDLILKHCDAILARGWQPLKGGRLLWGQDVAARVPDEPLERYLRRRVHGFVVYAQIIRGQEGMAGHYPLALPQPDAPYCGYGRFGLLTGDGWRPGTRTLINLVTAATSVRLAAMAGVRAHSKADSIERYAQLVGDDWAAFASELYALCRGRLAYALPGDDQPRERETLTRLCTRVADFENGTLRAVADRIEGFPRLVPPPLA